MTKPGNADDPNGRDDESRDDDVGSSAEDTTSKGEKAEISNTEKLLKRRQRRRFILFTALAAIFVLVTSARSLAVIVTDFWWFGSVGYTSVWYSKFATQTILALAGGAIFFALLYVNLRIVDSLAPKHPEPTQETLAIESLKNWLGGNTRLIKWFIVISLTFRMALVATQYWQEWMLFSYAKPWGQTDAHFGSDIGFYVFTLPVLQFLFSWLFTAATTTLIVSLFAHYVVGGVRIDNYGDRTTVGFQRHISVLLAALALLRAFGYWIERYSMTYNTSGRFTGAGYVDTTVRIPVFELLTLIALFSAAVFIWNFRRLRWALVMVTCVIWLVVSLVMTQLYPQAIQRLTVTPDETTKEAEFVERHIQATREAYGLDTVATRVFDYSRDLIGADLQTNADNVAAVPIVHPSISAKTFQLQQAERSFFRFAQDAVDVDRYVIDGKVVPVVIGARELNLTELPEGGWESEVLSYTHGNGLALAPANRVRDNLPDFLIGDLPLNNRIESDVPITQQRTYFGETMYGYAIINTDRDEIDSLEDGARITHNYEGNGGVRAGSNIRRAVFALRFGDLDPLISDFVREDSRFIWNRNIRGRVQKVAPFLKVDSNPYPVVVDGRMLYIADVYTTADTYPYSQNRRLEQSLSSSGLASQFNYVRNSVKAVVDAYEGTVKLYVVDDSDPVIRAWRSALPDVFESAENMSADLRQHLRYPQDLFAIQTNMWQTYHINADQTTDFLEGSDEWSIAQDPGGVKGAELRALIDAAGEVVTSEQRVAPYYTLMRLPEETKQEFVIVRTFVPYSRGDDVKELQAMLMGVSETVDGSYGRLVSYEISNARGSQDAPAPALVASQITSQDQISERISLLNAKDEGSSVEFGDLVVLPVQDSLIYVRPLYVIATGTRQPNLEWVIISHSDRVVMCHNYAGAIHALFGVSVKGVDQSVSDPECLGDVVYKPNESAAAMAQTSRQSDRYSSGPVSIFIGDGTAAEEALKLLHQADMALEAGELGTYQLLVDTARELLEESLADSSPTDPTSADGSDDGGSGNAGGSDDGASGSSGDTDDGSNDGASRSGSASGSGGDIDDGDKAKSDDGDITSDKGDGG